MFGESIDISETLIVTVFSMAIVFATLIVISFVLDGFKVAFHKDNKKKETIVTKPEPTQEIVEEENSEELIAVIAAAIAASMNTPIDNIHIKNITRVSQSTPVWGRMGRQEQIYN